jgi:shikimate dehydrogenase
MTGSRLRAGRCTGRAVDPGLRRRAAVLGSPIAHSLSPVLHRAAYAALGLDWAYDAIECDEAGLPALLAGLGPEFAGLSLTMPLKATVLPLLDSVTPLAVAVEAANTVVLRDGHRHGDNTDVAGMVRALSDAGVEPGERPVVLGAGGTARSALAALGDLGAREVTVVVRDTARARSLQAAGERVQVDVRLAAWPGAAAVREASLLVSTVPAGAADGVAGVAPDGGWWPDLPLFDVLYHPWPTRLAAAAQEAGAPVVGGLDLLVAQAVLQVELMTGRRPPVEPLAAAGRAALAARSR